MKSLHKSKDFYSVAYLMCLGIPLHHIERDSDGKSVFICDCSPEDADEILRTYWAGQAKVNPLTYRDRIRDLKTLLYSA